MAKTDKWERQHRADMARIERQVLAIYEAAAREAAAIGMTVGDLTGDLFTFDRYPITKERIERLLNDMHDRLETVVVNGVNSQWTLANNKNNELCRRVFGSALNSLTLQQQRRYFNNHDAAREAFLARKEAGLGLSDRVWRYSDLYRHEIELGLDVGLRAGTSADELTRELRSYLKYPDKLFRRVRDEHGQLVLSQAAKDFHPGQGVYRSSYMNARRLAATETNMAYRTADYDRYQDLDFVVGIEVHLSNNHNCKGVPAGAYYDICDELQGKYPKDFKFTGWHPHCRCYVTTILKTDKEIAADNERIMAGLEPSEESENEVMVLPKGFVDWQYANVERAKNHYTMPYFVHDNPQYINDGLLNAYGVRNPYRTFAEYEAAMRFNKRHAAFSPEQQQNIRELNNVMPVTQGRVMNFTEADEGKANPNYGVSDAEALGFWHNCQTCTMAYELRRRGYNVEAVANPLVPGYKKYRNFSAFCTKKHTRWEARYLNADGSTVKMEYSSGLKDSVEAKRNYIKSKTTEVGRYEVYCQWKGEGAHVFIVERGTDGKLLWFDPQTGKKGGSFKKYLEDMKADNICVVRIDDKLINPLFAERFLKA